MDSGGKPKSKFRRSCEHCRDFKIRCQPSGEKNEDRCQRCIKERRKCVFLEAKPRPKRARNSKLRVDEMEQKLQNLIDMVTADAQTGPVSQQEATSSDIIMPGAQSGEISESVFLEHSSVVQMKPSLKTSNSPRIFRNPMFSPSGASSFMIFDDLQDVISRGIVTLETAEESLQYFRSTASTFPFVIIPPHTSLDYLRRQKPFLLLAILAMATTDSLKRQKVLDQELRDTVGRRVFMYGEKSLDLLQGLLVYLTWHHLFFEPDNHQIYQLCQLAVSMAIDLEITIPQQRRKHTPSHSFNLLSVIAESKSPAKMFSTEDAEARRAYLGCYYISSTLCMGLRKPNNLKYTAYTEDCCQALAAAQEVESDALIQYFILMEKLTDDINQTFDYVGHQEMVLLDPLRVKMLVKTFKDQLIQLEKSFPPEVWKHDMLMMTYYHLRTFVNEVGFHNIAAPPLSGHSQHHAQPSLVRTDLLLNCLSAAKDYLDRYISLPIEALFGSSFADYAKLVYNVLILKIFSTWSDDGNSSLEATQIQSTANMYSYMQALVRKFEEMGKVSRQQGVLEDYTLYLTHLFRTYETRARDGMGARQWTANDMSVLEMLPLPSYELDSSAVLQLEDKGEEEQWADMLLSSSLDPLDTSTEVLFA